MRFHHGLLHILDFRRIRQIARVVHHKLRPIVFHYLINDARRSCNKVKIKLTLQTLLDDLHMQKPQEAATESESKRHRGFRFVGKGCIV